MQNTSHAFLTKTELANDKFFNYEIDAQKILLDLKVLLRDYYVATFTGEENVLKVTFNNGQTFLLRAEEYKVT